MLDVVSSSQRSRNTTTMHETFALCALRTRELERAKAPHLITAKPIARSCSVGTALWLGTWDMVGSHTTWEPRPRQITVE